MAAVSWDGLLGLPSQEPDGIRNQYLVD